MLVKFTSATSLATIFISLVSVKSEPSLSLRFTGDERVVGVQNLKVTATLENTGNETLRIVNDPRGALSKAPTNTFTIRNVNGTSPSFTGVKLKYSHRNVLARGRKESFTILAPGDSIRVEHDLSKAYNFTTPGAGPYTFAAKSSVFHYVDAKTNQTQTLQARVSPHRAIVTGQLAVGHRKRYRSPYAKRAEFESCSAEQSAAILEATKAAKTMTGESLGALNTTQSDRYTKWWGSFDEGRHKTLLDHFRKLNSNDFGSFTYDCGTCDDTDSFAFVYPDDFGVIYLCGAFWNSELTGEDSKAGTLVHEASHFAQNGATEDNIYGREDCAQLAKTHPGEAVGNADSHEYFAEDSPTTPKKS